MGRNDGTKLIRGVLAIAGIALVFTGSGFITPQATASDTTLQAFKPHEIVVAVRPGQSSSVLAPLLAEYNAKILESAPDGSYKIGLPPGVDPAQVAARQAQILASNPLLKYVTTNKLVTLSYTLPNDTYFADQYALQPGVHLQVPQAWDLIDALPQREVVVAVIDSGIRDSIAKVADKGIVRIPHPDLISHLLVGQGYDFGEGDNDPAPDETLKDVIPNINGHGTHVAGIIAATSNNSLGVSGIARDNVWILPLKVAAPVSDESQIDIFAVAKAINYCATARVTSPRTGDSLPISVINLSLGWRAFLGDDPTVHSAVANAADHGVVIVASSGNYRYQPEPVEYPARYSQVIAVGAVDKSGQIAYFSDRGPEVAVVAPGVAVASTIWDRPSAAYQYSSNNNGGTASNSAASALPAALNPDEIAGGDTFGNAYVEWDGTSMASPHVAAVAAILRSIGIPAANVPDIIKQSAVPLAWQTGRPDNLYGYGEVNLPAAIKLALMPTASIAHPVDNSYSSERRPTVEMSFRNVAKETIQVVIDGRVVIGPASANPEIGDMTPYYKVVDSFARTSQLAFPYALMGDRRTHTIKVTAQSALGSQSATAQAGVQFVVNLANLTKGWHMFSVPYSYKAGAVAPEVAIANTTGALYRWTYGDDLLGHYAKYSWVKDAAGAGDPEATLVPPSVMSANLVRPVGQTAGTAPAGVGYWLYLADGPIPVPDSYGVSVAGGPYEVGLQYGWNIVGNPFPFAIGWNSVLVEYAGERVTAAEAATKGWISGSIFRWDSQISDYKQQSATSGALPAWEGEWVRAKVRRPIGMQGPDVKLILAPNPFVGSVN